MNKVKFDKDNSMIIKGIAILFMVIHHCYRKKELFSDYQVDFYPFSQSFVVEMATFFKICVGMFVFITGYGLTLSLKKKNSNYVFSVKEQYRSTVARMIRLLSGYMLIYVLSLVILQMVDGKVSKMYFAESDTYGWFQVAVGFFGVSKLFSVPLFNGAWWYMSAAVIFVMLTPILAYLVKKFGFIHVAAWCMILPRLFGIGYLGSNAVLSFVFPLVLGIGFAEHDLMNKILAFQIGSGKVTGKLAKFILEFIMVIGCFWLYISVPEYKIWEIHWGIMPVIIICFCCEFLNFIPVFRQIFLFLGKHSMNIFLVHTFFNNPDYTKDYIYSYHNWAVIVLMILGISLIISIILEGLKKIIYFDQGVDRFIKIIDGKINRVIF